MKKHCQRSFAVCCLLALSVQATLLFPPKPTWMQKYRMKKSLLAAKNSGLPPPPPIGYADYAALAQAGYMSPYPAALVPQAQLSNNAAQVATQVRSSPIANYYVPTPALAPFPYRWNFGVARPTAPIGSTNSLAANPMMQFAYLPRNPYFYGNNFASPVFGYPTPVYLRAAPIQYSNDIRTPAAQTVPLVPEANYDGTASRTDGGEISEGTYTNGEQQDQQQPQQQQQQQQQQQSELQQQQQQQPQEQKSQEVNTNSEKSDEYSYPSDSALNRLRRVAKKKNARNHQSKHHHRQMKNSDEEEDRRSGGPAALGFQPMPINSPTMLDAEEEIQRNYNNNKNSNYRQRDYSPRRY